MALVRTIAPGQRYMIVHDDEEMAIEVVKIHRPGRGNLLKLAFEAPQSFQILRMPDAPERRTPA